MANSKVDPVYEYVDNEIRLIKAEQKKALLETQRFIAKFHILDVHNQSLYLLERQQPEKGKDSIAQFTADSSSAISKLDTSDNPLSIAEKFSEKRNSELKQLGVKFVTVSL